MHWYHDHRLDADRAATSGAGLAGMWISDDDFEASLPLPRGSREIPLMMADRSFDRDNQLTNPFSAGDHAPNDGVTGKHILVNGAILPYHPVQRLPLPAAGAQRLQLPLLQPDADRRRHDHPDRHRVRADAAAAAPQPGADRTRASGST